MWVERKCLYSGTRSNVISQKLIREFDVSMNNDIRLDLNKTQQYKNIRLEYLTPSTEIYIYKSV